MAHLDASAADPASWDASSVGLDDEQHIAEEAITNISEMSAESDHNVWQEITTARVAAMDAELGAQAVIDEVRARRKFRIFQTLRGDVGTRMSHHKSHCRLT